MTPPQPGDLKAGFVGLFAAVAFLLVMVYGMVQWTNSRFEGHGAPAAGPTAGATAPATH